jgi:predicted PurR-regulated permease PerM
MEITGITGKTFRASQSRTPVIPVIFYDEFSATQATSASHTHGRCAEYASGLYCLRNAQTADATVSLVGRSSLVRRSFNVDGIRMTRFAVPRFVIILIAVIGALWLIQQVFSLVYRIADVLLLFGLAWLLTLLLEPLISRFSRVGVPRSIGILVAYLLTIGSLIGGVIALAPQVSTLSRNIPTLVQEVALRAEDGAIWLQQRGVEIDPQALTNQIIGLGGQFGSRVASRIVFFAQSVLGLIGRVALVITISVFMSLMSGRMRDVFRPVVPPRWRDEYDAFVQDVNTAYSSYIRGFFYIVALGTLLSGSLLFVFKVPNPVIWLMVIFILRLLPFLGGTLANALFVLVVFVALPWTTAMVATAVLMIGQLVLTNVLMPRVMGRELGINPLLVLFAVLIGGKIYGVAGILFAIPAAAVIATVVGKAVNRYLLPAYAKPGWWTQEVEVGERVATPVPTDGPRPMLRGEHPAIPPAKPSPRT